MRIYSLEVHKKDGISQLNKKRIAIGLVSLFYGISTFMGWLMSEPSL